MPERNRIPEPTIVEDKKLRDYLYGLIRILRFNYSDLNDRVSQILNQGFTVQTGDIIVNDSDNGVVLTSPDGTQWRLEVDNAGVLSTTSL